MLLPSEKLWDRASRTPVLLASAGMVGVIALVDWWTAPYVSLGFLYLLPIVLVAGFLPRAGIALVCVSCAALSEAFSSLGPTGRIIRLIFEMLALGGVGLFVSELLRNRRLSLESQERLRALVETSPAAIVTLDHQGMIELANRAAVELMVPEESNLIGQPIATFVPDLQNALNSDGGAQLRASMQCRVRRRDGETVAAEVWFSTYSEDGSQKLAAIIADITEDHHESIRSDLTIRPDQTGRSEQTGMNGLGRPGLNNRQLAVLRLLFEGLSNREIASRLEMTPSAVKNTLQQLFSKAGVNKRSQLVRVALEQHRDLL
jgi:PAS domain S-box-containing protein